ncbi:flagellar export protein FliJ [Anoxybacillus sp. CHMUD]|uniref:flagellar export protein FliJ n=1 Tax=Anoxybacillus sp. CHMUD TaxID=2508870 RepID=UPI001492221A|nr:flagellar export protein FliJ [Anoxybacillus sp. CHMUD]NNU89414.1 flagellar biosynthesis chaperone FliJ [Anoxybacillus sp. CHMUD]
MTSFQLTKILNLKEYEKQKALHEYEEARRRFEEVAEKLYHFLKQKEDYEEQHKQQLQSGLAVQHIRSFQQFMNNLQRVIDHYQHLVMQARQHMELKQLKLVELNVEVKKYEKIKEKHDEMIAQQMRIAEQKQMDDISIQQYCYRETR